MEELILGDQYDSVSMMELFLGMLNQQTFMKICIMLATGHTETKRKQVQSASSLHSIKRFGKREGSQ